MMELMMREIGSNSAEAHDGGLGRDRTWHMGCSPYKYVDSFMAVSLNGATSRVTLFLFIRSCVQ